MKLVGFCSIIAAFFMLAGCATTNRALPFAGNTDCKPIKRMTQQQWRQSILGNDLYIRNRGHQVKNTMKIRQWNKQNKR